MHKLSPFYNHLAWRFTFVSWFLTHVCTHYYSPPFLPSRHLMVICRNLAQNSGASKIFFWWVFLPRQLGYYVGECSRGFHHILCSYACAENAHWYIYKPRDCGLNVEIRITRVYEICGRESRGLNAEFISPNFLLVFGTKIHQTAPNHLTAHQIR